MAYICRANIFFVGISCRPELWWIFVVLVVLGLWLAKYVSLSRNSEKDMCWQISAIVSQMEEQAVKAFGKPDKLVVAEAKSCT